MSHRSHPLTVSALLSVFTLALGVFGASHPVRSAGVVRPVAQGSQTARSLTTPDLINQAHRKGELTAEKRLTYLVFAVYDISRVPAHLRGGVRWDATQVVAEINAIRRVQRQGLASYGSEFSAALAASAPLAATVCDREDGPNTVQTEHFLINYDVIKGDLTLQQYQDALETAFTKEITEFGYPNPPTLTPSGKYAIQILQTGDVPGEVYGYVTDAGGSFTGDVGDNPNTAPVETAAKATCMVVADDFSAFANEGNADARAATGRITGHGRP